jgi:hypothetical protein
MRGEERGLTPKMDLADEEWERERRAWNLPRPSGAVVRMRPPRMGDDPSRKAATGGNHALQTAEGSVQR